MSEKNKEMVGNYEVIQRLWSCDRELLIGYDPNDADGMFLTCIKEVSALGVRYLNAMVSDDYIEIARLFASRLNEALDKAERSRPSKDFSLKPLGAEHCRERGEHESLAGKLIIIRPESIPPEYRTPDHQLGYATGGFGCAPSARGRAVYFRALYSGKECRWNIGDVLGIADMERLPEWAKQKVAEQQKARAEKIPDRGVAR